MCGYNPFGSFVFLNRHGVLLSLRTCATCAFLAEGTWRTHFHAPFTQRHIDTIKSIECQSDGFDPWRKQNEKEVHWRCFLSEIKCGKEATATYQTSLSSSCLFFLRINAPHLVSLCERGLTVRFLGLGTYFGRSCDRMLTYILITADVCPQERLQLWTRIFTLWTSAVFSFSKRRAVVAAQSWMAHIWDMYVSLLA